MGVLDETIEVPRKTMCLFFLVDGSGSMSGDNKTIILSEDSPIAQIFNNIK